MPRQTVGDLQAMLVGAVAGDRQLPGSTRPFSFPDRDFVLAEPTVVLADDNLVDPDALRTLSTPVEIASVSAIRERAREQGDITYLHFRPVEREGETVWLTLRAQIAPRDQERQPLGLSGVRVGFREIDDGQWEVVEEPTFFAE